MKKLVLISLMMFVPTATQAQNQEVITTDLQQEILAEGAGQKVQKLRQQAKKKAVKKKRGLLPQQETIVVEPYGAGDAVMYEEQTTYVEAAPLSASSAERLRRARQEAELNTERKIVEKLEVSRLEDEKKRAQRLFGNRLEPANEPPQQPVQPQPLNQYPPAPVQQVIVPVEEPKQDNTEAMQDMKAEIMSEIEDLKQKEEVKEKRSFMMGGVGMAEYVDVNNMQGNIAAGFAFGVDLPNKMTIEGGLQYSNYYIDEYWRFPLFKELDQYNINATVRYSLFDGAFKPQVGAMVSYTYRKYFDRGYYGIYQRDNEVTSNAFDMGLVLGAEVEVSEDFSIGVDYRYLINVASRTDSDFLSPTFSQSRFGTPVEEIDYYYLTLNGKFKF